MPANDKTLGNRGGSVERLPARAGNASACRRRLGPRRTVSLASVAESQPRRHTGQRAAGEVAAMSAGETNAVELAKVEGIDGTPPHGCCITTQPAFRSPRYWQRRCSKCRIWPSCLFTGCAASQKACRRRLATPTICGCAPRCRGWPTTRLFTRFTMALSATSSRRRLAAASQT